MGRHAHGRLAAIAMLAAGLSTCATTPEPVHHAEREKHKLPVGDQKPPRVSDLLPLSVDGYAEQNCAGADAGARYGAVKVVVQKGPEGKPLIETEILRGSGGLNEDDRACVGSATDQAIEFLRREYGSDFPWWEGNVVWFDVTLGTPPPAHPAPTPEF